MDDLFVEVVHDLEEHTALAELVAFGTGEKLTIERRMYVTVHNIQAYGVFVSLVGVKKKSAWKMVWEGCFISGRNRKKSEHFCSKLFFGMGRSSRTRQITKMVRS